VSGNIYAVSDYVGDTSGNSQTTSLGRYNNITSFVSSNGSTNSYNFDGNVGIGTTAPTNRLDVIQSGYTAGVRVSGGTHTQIRVEGTSAQAKLQVCDSCSGGLNDVGNGIGLLGTENTYPFAIYTNNTERVRITSTGNVGIGTTTPLNKLDIAGASAIGSDYAGAYTAPTNGAIIEGNVGIGTTTPASTLTVNGHIGTDGLAPALTSCGTSPSIVAGSTDTAGEVTEGSISTGCTITFKVAYTRAPFVTVTAQSGLVFTYTVSASAITITNVGALSSTKLNYHVISTDL
jgi:hypothetical protein